MPSEREKMVAGELYDPLDPELVAARARCRVLLRRLNAADQAERPPIYAELIGAAGPGLWIEPPFHCDYGSNITVGEKVYFNFNCVILDVFQDGVFIQNRQVKVEAISDGTTNTLAMGERHYFDPVFDSGPWNDRIGDWGWCWFGAQGDALLGTSVPINFKLPSQGEEGPGVGPVRRRRQDHAPQDGDGRGEEHHRPGGEVTAGGNPGRFPVRFGSRRPLSCGATHENREPGTRFARPMF
jgi:hypothetical protein